MVVCKDSGMLPNEFCPVHEERIYAYLPEKERESLLYSWLDRHVNGIEGNSPVQRVE